MRITLCLAGFCALLSVSQTACCAEEGETEQELRVLVNQYEKAFAEQKLSDIMKTVAVPFYLDGIDIVESREKLELQFAAIIKKNADRKKDLSNVKFDIKQIASLRTFREEKKYAPPSKEYSMGEVLKPGDLVVYIEYEVNKKKSPLWLAVRVDKKNGHKIVGGAD